MKGEINLKPYMIDSSYVFDYFHPSDAVHKSYALCR